MATLRKVMEFIGQCQHIPITYSLIPAHQHLRTAEQLTHRIHFLEIKDSARAQ